MVDGRLLVEADIEASGRPERFLQNSHHVDSWPLDAVDQPLRLAPDQWIGERVETTHAEVALECDVTSRMTKQLAPIRRRQ